MSDRTVSDDNAVFGTPEVKMVGRDKISTMGATERLQLLRAPFSAIEVGRLPQPVAKDGQKTRCEPNTGASRDSYFCGGYHAPSIHLSYVGHAALTNRLLEVDPGWYWEPMGTDAQGLPAIDKSGGLWIRLHVLGVSRPGYGDAGGKTGGNAVKEAIGDALRNAAMRFGAALDLWHKGELTSPGTLEDANTAPEDGGRNWAAEAENAGTLEDITAIWHEAKAAGAPVQVLDQITGVATRVKKVQGGR